MPCRSALPSLLLLACTAAQPDVVEPDSLTLDSEPATPELSFPLSPEAQLSRVSIALRGVRPSLEEHAQLASGATTLAQLTDRWLDDPRLGEAVRELYSELLRNRAASLQFPALGPLTGQPKQDLAEAISEEPLALIEHVVTHDLPFTDIVTADYTVLDGRAARMWSGHDYDPGGPDVQQVRWTDGRPAAGILSTNGLWVRHRSTGSNHQRGRANLIADALLCNDFFEFNVPIEADVDLSNPDAVASAIRTVPECVACHDQLDPLAAHLWPIAPQVEAGGVALSYLLGCNGPPLLNFCYPIQMYFPELAPAWFAFQLPAPAYYDQRSSTLSDLGAAIAADPRFSSCASRRFAAWFTQREAKAVPAALVLDLDDRFVQSGLSAKALIRAIVLHPDFLSSAAETPEANAALAGPQVLRPSQLGSVLEDLTGFRYQLDVDTDNLACRFLQLDCYGMVDVYRDDTFGFRTMAGGVDGDRVTRPTHSPTPTGLLVLAAMAEEAAGAVVERDLATTDPSARHLLRLVEADTTDEATVRAQLAELHLRVLGERVAVDSPEVDDTWALFSSVSVSPRRAWKLTLSSLFQAPQMLFY